MFKTELEINFMVYITTRVPNLNLNQTIIETMLLLLCFVFLFFSSVLLEKERERETWWSLESVVVEATVEKGAIGVLLPSMHWRRNGGC